jgi:hypothetical protein
MGQAKTARDVYLQITVTDARGDMAFSSSAMALAALAWRVARKPGYKITRVDDLLPWTTAT